MSRREVPGGRTHHRLVCRRGRTGEGKEVGRSAREDGTVLGECGLDFQGRNGERCVHRQPGGRRTRHSGTDHDALTVVVRVGSVAGVGVGRLGIGMEVGRWRVRVLTQIRVSRLPIVARMGIDLVESGLHGRSVCKLEPGRPVVRTGGVVSGGSDGEVQRSEQPRQESQQGAGRGTPASPMPDEPTSAHTLKITSPTEVLELQPPRP